MLELAKVLQRVEELLTAGVSGASIGIASPYSRMHEYAHGGRDWLALRHPVEAPDITVAIIDGFTGLEVDILLIPLVVGANIGFLRETSRICTALTRCWVGFVLIGNTTAMRSGEGTRGGWDGTALKRVVLELTQCGMSVTSKMKVAPAGMIDYLPKEEELDPYDRRDCYRCDRPGHIASCCPYEYEASYSGFSVAF